MPRSLRLLALLFGSAVVALLVRAAGPAALLAGLRAFGWIVVLLVPLWGLVYLLNAIAWRLLLSADGAGVPLRKAWAATITGFSVNAATPLAGFGGEPVKVMAVKKHLGTQRAAGSAVAFRLLHAQAHTLTFLVAIVAGFVVLPHTPVILTALSAGLLFFGVIAWFLNARHREGMAVHLFEWLRRVPLLGRVARRFEARAHALHDVDAFITEVYRTHPRRYYTAMAVELLARILMLSEYLIVLRGMGIAASPVEALLVASFASLVVNLLIFLPYELGSREGGSYLALHWLGLTPALAVQAALLVRLRELTWICIGMLLLWTVKE